MKVSIRTKNQAVLTPFERNVIREAAHFYADTLLSKRITDNINLRINIIQDYYKKTGFMGDAAPIDDENYYRPRNFEINIEKTKRLKSIVFSLAHEMIHVKQFAKGELKDHKRSNKVIFHKVKFDDDNYWESPWEIEAYGKECGLWQRFKPIYKYLHRENRS